MELVLHAILDLKLWVIIVRPVLLILSILLVVVNVKIVQPALLVMQQMVCVSHARMDTDSLPISPALCVILLNSPTQFSTVKLAITAA